MSLPRTTGAIGALCGLAFLLAGCATDDTYVGYQVGVGYGGPYGYGDPYGYDPYGYNYPYGVYSGSIFYSGVLYRGPHRYRDGPGGREFWLRNGWRRDGVAGDGNWRGPRGNAGGPGRGGRGGGNAGGPPNTPDSNVAPIRGGPRGTFSAAGQPPVRAARPAVARPNPAPQTRGTRAAQAERERRDQ